MRFIVSNTFCLPFYSYLFLFSRRDFYISPKREKFEFYNIDFYKNLNNTAFKLFFHGVKLVNVI